MDRDRGAEQALAHPVRRLIDVPVLPLLGLIGDVVDLREVVAVLVERRDLGGAAGRQQGVRAEAVVGAGELVPVRAPRDEVRQAEQAHDPLVDLEVLLDLLLRVLVRRVGRVRLEEMDLPDAHEGPRHLRLVAEDGDDLVHLQRQVGMTPDPEAEHRVHRRLRCRPQHESHVELVQPAAGDPEHVPFEALDMLGLLLELRLRDRDGEVDLAMAGRIELLAHRLVDQLHDCPAIGAPDVHPFDRVPLVAQLRPFDNAVVPFAEFFVLAHGNARAKESGR